MIIASIAFDFFFFISRVALLQIWKTEYTKVQLSGHEEHSVSRGDVVSLSAEDTGNTNTLHLNSSVEQEPGFSLVPTCLGLCWSRLVAYKTISTISFPNASNAPLYGNNITKIVW